MIAQILAFFQGLFEALKIVYKYLPPKSTEQKVEDGQQAVADETQKMKDEGRP